MTSAEGWDECTMPGCHAACDPKEEFCAVHRETTGYYNKGLATRLEQRPMRKAWQFLKGIIGSPEDKARSDEMWQNIQSEEERRRQQQGMETPLCELCRRNPAVRESEQGEPICRECDEEVLQNWKRLMREQMGLPPEGAAE